MFASKKVKASRGRRAAVEVAQLECRSLLSTGLTISESVNPQVLWPPNGRLVPVHVSGTISDDVGTVNSVQYTVQDSEAATTAPILSGPVTLSNSGQYSFTVDLQALCSGHDHNGRQYTINITAGDNAGVSATDFAIVTVPHDQGHRGRSGGSNLNGGNTGAGTGGLGPSGRHGVSGGAGGASNRLSFGGPGQGQVNTVTVPGNNNTVTQNVTNTQTNNYTFNNSFKTTVTNPPVSTPSSPAPTPTPPMSSGG